MTQKLSHTAKFLGEFKEAAGAELAAMLVPALLGGAGAGALGAGATALDKRPEAEETPEERRRRILRNATAASLLGAGAVGGLGLAANEFGTAVPADKKTPMGEVRETLGSPAGVAAQMGVGGYAAGIGNQNANRDMLGIFKELDERGTPFRYKQDFDKFVGKDSPIKTPDARAVRREFNDIFGRPGFFQRMTGVDRKAPTMMSELLKGKKKNQLETLMVRLSEAARAGGAKAQPSAPVLRTMLDRLLSSGVNVSPDLLDEVHGVNSKGIGSVLGQLKGNALNPSDKARLVRNAIRRNPIGGMLASLLRTRGIKRTVGGAALLPLLTGFGPEAAGAANSGFSNIKDFFTGKEKQ